MAQCRPAGDTETQSKTRIENRAKEPVWSWFLVLIQPARVYFISYVQSFSKGSKICGLARVLSEIK